MTYVNIENIARNAGWLVIKAASNAAAKTVNAVKVTLNGSFVDVAAWDVVLTNYTYLTPNPTATRAYSTAAYTIADWYTSIATVYATSAGAFVIWKWAEVANTAAYTTKSIDRSLNKDYAIVGYIVIKNATGSVFTGWTTALDAANLTVTYLDAFTPVGM